MNHHLHGVERENDGNLGPGSPTVECALKVIHGNDGGHQRAYGWAFSGLALATSAIP